MAELTQFAPRGRAAGWLAAAVIVNSCTLAAPAAAQHLELGDGLSAPRSPVVVAPVHVAIAAPATRPVGRPAPLGVRVVAEAGASVLTLGVAIATPALIAGLSARNCSGELFCIGPEVWATFFGALGAVLGEALLPQVL